VVPEQIHTYLCAETRDQVTDATIALSLFQYPGCIIPICISVTVSTARRGFAASSQPSGSLRRDKVDFQVERFRVSLAYGDMNDNAGRQVIVFDLCI